MKKLLLPPVFALLCLSSHAQENRITIDAGASLGEISPYVYGQFVEYMGRCIDGGIFDEDSPLSDSRGFRDVLEKVKELSPTMLRFPGGTAVKTFHWEDGVGPKEERKARKNLIWGGINDFHFGTCEFIEYCREIGAEPCLVVNLSTGSPDEAANWVEYCNGTENTYYANLRRSHGYPEPFGVKYWALGNEEGAEPDAGRHQDPRKYVEDVWHFIKLMKLTDPSIKLIANGEGGDMRWNETVLDGLGGAVDYISYHNYVNTEEGKPYSLFRKIKAADRGLAALSAFIRENCPDSVDNWQVWYRFPPRQDRIRIAFDEWGIWEAGGPPYGTTNTYDGVFSQRHPPQRPPRRNSQLGADGEHPRPDHDRRNRLGKADDVLPAPGIPRERTERERKGRGRIPRNGHGRRFAGRLRDHRPGARKAQPVRRQSQPEGPEDAHRLRKLQGGQAHTDHRAVGRIARCQEHAGRPGRERRQNGHGHRSGKGGRNHVQGGIRHDLRVRALRPMTYGIRDAGPAYFRMPGFFRMRDADAPAGFFIAGSLRITRFFLSL